MRFRAKNFIFIASAIKRGSGESENLSRLGLADNDLLYAFNQFSTLEQKHMKLI